MELWIRSQNREILTKVNNLRLFYSKYENVFVIEDYDDLGIYKSKERALEVLDEISNKIKNQFILKEKTILKPDDIAKEHKRLNYLYSGEFIMENPPYEIVPINSNIIYYEMPEE